MGLVTLDNAAAIMFGIAKANRGLATFRQARAADVPSQRLTELVRLGALARVARGVYAAAGTTRELVDPRALTIAWRVVLSHESAAAWWGVELPAPPGALHVTAPRSRHRPLVSGVRLHRAALAPGTTRTVRGVRVTSPARTVLDIARHAPLEHAVAIADSFLRARLLTLDELRSAAWAAKGPGRRRIVLAVSLVDPRSGSLLESLTRMLMWRGNVAPPVSQHWVEHGDWAGRLDFAWPALRVALECDGYEWHAERDSYQRDRRRWSALSRAGWRVAVVTWHDVMHEPGYVLALVRDLMSAAAAA